MPKSNAKVGSYLIIPASRDMKFHAAHTPTNMSVDEALGGHAYAHAMIFNPAGVIERFARHWKEADLPYALKCLVPEVHGLAITPRIVQPIKTTQPVPRKNLGKESR